MTKTIKVADLIAEVNRRNRESTCSPEARNGWNNLLEGFLHATDNYNGFGYLKAGEVPAGELPGIKGEPESFTFPDESRKRYYANPRLTGAREKKQ